MGIGGFFKGLGKVALNVVPALFTGGASLPATAALSTGGKIMSALGKVAPIAQGLAGGMQKGREAENTAAETAAQFALRESGQHEGQVMDRAGLDFKQREMKQDMLERAYKAARMSALAKNMKDVTLSGVPKGITPIRFGGGMKPSAFGQEGLDAATVMNDKAMRALVTGEQFGPLDPLERIKAAEHKKAGILENIAGGVGMVGGAKNAYDTQQKQDSMQDRIAAAIERLGGQAAAIPPGNANMSGDPRLAGVTPFVNPPTAKFKTYPQEGE